MAQDKKPKTAPLKHTEIGGCRTKIPPAKTSDQRGLQPESSSWGASTSIDPLQHDTSVDSNIGPKSGVETTSKAPSSQHYSTYSTRTPEQDAVMVVHPSIMRAEVPITECDLMKEPHIDWAEDSHAVGDENNCDSPLGMVGEAPQLQAWVYETSSSELTVGERLQKSYWEVKQSFLRSR